MRYFKLICALGVAVLVFAFLYISMTRQKLPILLYHHLLTDAENTNPEYMNESVLTPESFEKQMEYLHNEGYETITVSELYDFLHHKKKLNGKKVMITFDDGYASNYRYAYDILKKYNYTAVVFLITGYITDMPEPFDPQKLTMLSLAEMEKSADVFEFGSHTNDMHRENENYVPFLLCKSDEEITDDLLKSFSVPGVQNIFAYPYGDYNKSNREVLRKLDVSLAFGVADKYATNYSNPYKIPRFSIYRDFSMEDFAGIFEK